MFDRIAQYRAATAALSEMSLPDSREKRMRIVTDLLWETLHRTSVSWVGFYIDQPGKPDDERLVLGPSRDEPACPPVGLHGVCGQALVQQRTRIVRDVAELGANYVACDPRDRSEIAIPLASDVGRCDAVLDLDSHLVAAFSITDDQGLREVLGAARLTPVDLG